MLRPLRRIFHPLDHSADARRINGRTLAIIHFDGSANRHRAARYVAGVLGQTKSDAVDGVVVDFSNVDYVFGNNSTFTVLHNFLHFERRFVRVVPGAGCESGLGVFVRLHAEHVSPTVEAAVNAFAASEGVA